MERTVTLQKPGCFDDGRTMHELMHSLGINTLNFRFLTIHPFVTKSKEYQFINVFSL